MQAAMEIATRQQSESNESDESDESEAEDSVAALPGASRERSATTGKTSAENGFPNTAAQIDAYRRMAEGGELRPAGSGFSYRV
jgi:hypothetical protein